MRRVPWSLMALALLLTVAGSVRAADSPYQQMAKKSETITNLKSMLRPFVATCEEKKTRFSKLFCSALNERLKAQHQSRVYATTMEPSETGPLVVTFKAKPKPSMTLTLRGCLTCKEPLLDREGGDVSKSRWFTLKMPRDIRVRRGKNPYELVDIEIASTTVVLPEKMKAKQFKEEVLPFLRVDLHFRPVAGVTQVGRRFKYGVLNFELLGYRVYQRCSGDVYMAKPEMDGKYPVDKNDLTCPQNQPKKASKQPKLPATLPQAKVKELMELVGEDLRACYEQYGVKGDVPVDVVVATSGKIKVAKVAGELANTPTAQCVERLIKNITFPKFTGQDARLQWPFSLK